MLTTISRAQLMAAEFDPPFALFQFHAFQLVVGMESDLNAEIACYGFQIRDGSCVVCHNALPGEHEDKIGLH